MKLPVVCMVVISAVGASADLYGEAPPLITSAPEYSYSTEYEYYDACTDYESTVTNTIISTYCPDCEGGQGGSYGKSGILTTYETVYSQFCSTGLEQKTFTVTESCSSANQPRPTGYVPQGFTVTTAICTVCGSTPVTAVLTTPVPAAPTPGAGGSPGPTPAVGPPAPGYPPSSGESTPPPGAPPAPGSPPSSGGLTPPAGAPPAPGSPPSSGGSAPPAGAPPAPGSPSSGGSTPPIAGPPSSGGSTPPAGAPLVPGYSPSSGGSVPPVAGAAPPINTPYKSNTNGVLPTNTPSSGSGSPYASPVVPYTGAASSLSFSLSLFVAFSGMIVALACV